MEVEVISKEIIKPSAPTPPHLRTFKVCLLDQSGGTRYYVPAIYYYPNSKKASPLPPNHVELLLKSSLSETLTRFYPLAGRVKDRFTIDCNDEGVAFATALVRCSMDDALAAGRPPNLDSLLSLIPTFVYLNPQPQYLGVQVAIQLNTFSCGGVAISTFCTHKIMDGSTAGAFMNCWASIARGVPAVCPDYSAASVLPPSESVPVNFPSVTERDLMHGEGDGVSQRFVIGAEAISRLKAKAASESGVQNPTRVEVVTALLWKHAMAASRAVCGSNQPSMLSQAMDLRQRMVPPLPEYCVGNLNWKVIARCENPVTTELDGLVLSLRRAMEKSRNEIVPKLRGDGACAAYLNFFEDLQETIKSNINNLNPYTFTSWCGLGFNELDFGWGKPCWFSCLAYRTPPQMKNICTLIEAGSDGRIEAWLTLGQRELNVLQLDPEFLQYASLNPPLILE